MKDLDFTNYSILGSLEEVMTGKTRPIKLSSDFRWKAGTRVSFIHNIESLFTYKDCPDPKVFGTVVRVRTSSGDKTAHEDRVFVLWDDGVFRSVFSKHLKPEFKQRLASTVRRRIKTSMDLDGFLKCGSDLVHKATRDLWALRQEGDDYIIERLFQDTGEPLKV